MENIIFENRQRIAQLQKRIQPYRNYVKND